MQPNYERLGENVARAGERLARVSADAKAEQAILGYVLGAAYALRCAIRLKHADRTLSAHPEEYADQLSQVATELAGSESITAREWLAGFYFNVAIEHLNASEDRLRGLEPRRHRATRRARRASSGNTIKDDANKLKHDPTGLISARGATLGDAVSRLAAVAEKVETTPRASGPSDS